MAQHLDHNDFPDLDKQIETLLECKPLPENDVKILCEKVSYSLGQRSA